MPFRIAAFTVAAACVAVPLAAQRPRPRLDLAIGGGPVVAINQFKQQAKTGVFGQVTGGYRFRGRFPLGVQVAFQYMDIRGKSLTPFVVFPSRRLLSGFTELVVHFEVDEDSPLKAYVYGGPGYVRQTITNVQPNVSGSHIGLQLGLGLAYGFGSIRPYVEIMYQDVFLDGPNVKVAPLMFGVRIGKLSK